MSNRSATAGARGLVLWATMRACLATVVPCLAGCPASTTYGTAGAQGGTAKAPTVGAAGAGASGHASSGTGSGGASSGGSSGGSSGTTGSACDAAWIASWLAGGYLPAAGDCPAGRVELKGRLTDACGADATSSPPITVAFTAADALDPNITANTGPCGVYVFCVDAGTLLTPSFDVSGFAASQLATLLLAGPGNPSDDDNKAHTGLPLFCSSLVSAIASTLVPPVVPELALVTINLELQVPDAGDRCNDQAGWTFTLLGADGGIIDAPSFVLNGALPVQGDAGEGSSGVWVFYNVDPALESVGVVGSRSGNLLPDGGEQCPELSTDPSYAQFTGEIPLASATLTYFEYVLP